MYRRGRKSVILDDDFAMFKDEVQEKVRGYATSSLEVQAKIREDLKKAISECQEHMGGNLAYGIEMGINRRFIHYYSPRLRFLKKMYTELI